MNRRGSSDNFHDREFTPGHPGAPLDISTLAELQERVGVDLMHRPGRVYFHVVIICTGGEGLHEVDFTPVSLTKGRVVHVQPGQVHRWRLGRNYDATILYFRDDNNNADSDGWPIGPRWLDLTADEYQRSLNLIELTSEEYELGRPPASRDRALRGALQLLLVNLGLDRTGHAADQAQLPVAYLALMSQLETDRHWSRSVTDHAERLGYSARTLSRACQTAVGCTAKEVVDDRVVLEAKRLLIDPDTTADAVARALSFSDGSNFTKFFQRLTGENPDTWRLRHLQGSTSRR